LAAATAVSWRCRETLQQPGWDPGEVLVDPERDLLARYSEARERQAELLGPSQGPHQLVVAGRHVDGPQTEQPPEVGQRDAGLTAGRGQLGDMAHEGNGRGPDQR
jgi:hypothetical protein